MRWFGKLLGFPSETLFWEVCRAPEESQLLSAPHSSQPPCFLPHPCLPGTRVPGLRGQEGPCRLQQGPTQLLLLGPM